MAELTYTTRANIGSGQPEVGNDLGTALDEIKAALNDIDKEQLSTAAAQLLGMNNGTTVGRGKAVIATAESRTNTAYGTLTTPDRVTGIVMPTDGLLHVLYHATWEADTTTPSAAVFLGATQTKAAYSSLSAPTTLGSNAVNFVTATRGVLFSTGAGLYSKWGTSYTGGDVTTGQLIGAGDAANFPGVMSFFVAAGTYDVSVQFKVSAGSLTVRDRKLWAWTTGF